MINVKVICGDGRVLLAWRERKSACWTVRLPSGQTIWSHIFTTYDVMNRLCWHAVNDHDGVVSREVFRETSLGTAILQIK